MNKIKQVCLTVLCIILILSAFSGCSSTPKAIDFIYPFDGKISSFDPQIASSADEFLIIENCFEGLVRVMDDGTVQPGVAESWEISSDKLTYTFKLRQDAKWNIDTELNEDGEREKDSRLELVGYDFDPNITANDFVFALRRAVDKNTASPLYSSVANIVNAPEINSGSMRADKLGVRAVDNYTLEIKLKSPDEGFLNTLSTAVAMPCSETFFNATKGRYGLGTEYTLFNGQFYVDIVLDTSYVLDKNDLYFGEHPSAVSDITLKIKNEDSDIVKNLKNGYYDCAYISGKEYEQINDSNITAVPYSNKTWAFILNKNKLLFSNEKLRQAVCLSISDIDTEKHKYLSQATNFTPPSCIINGKSATEAMGSTVPRQDTFKAVEMWKKGLEETGYSSADLTVIVTEDMEEIAKEFVQGIQGSIGKVTAYGTGDENKINFSLKIEVLNQDSFNAAFSKGEYDLALYCFEATSQSADNYLDSIVKGNYAGEIEDAQKAVETVQNASAAEKVSAYRECETVLMNDYSVMPVLFESSYYAQAKGVSGVQFHPGSGRVSFVNATRED